MQLEHFNQLTPAEAERLAILMEELAEVQQVIGKILRHGYESANPRTGESNREQLMRELGDAQYMIRMMYEAGDISADVIDLACARKEATIQAFLHHNSAKLQVEYAPQG